MRKIKGSQLRPGDRLVKAECAPMVQRLVANGKGALVATLCNGREVYETFLSPGETYHVRRATKAERFFESLG